MSSVMVSAVAGGTEGAVGGTMKGVLVCPYWVPGLGSALTLTVIP